MQDRNLPLPRTVRRRVSRGLLGSLVAAALALGAAGAGAGDDDDDDRDEPDRGAAHCTTTARLMLAACGFERRDDRLVARAKCIHIGDARARAECLQEAREASTEARQTCRAQFEARREVCSLLGEARYDPPWDAQLFDADFRQLSNPNPYFPLGIGHRWVYLGEGERNVVEVLADTKTVDGVTCIVVRDLVHVSGRLKEATDDWFAAARDGGTWYCGEEVKDYEVFRGDRPPRPELVSIDGSFKHGRDHDKAGLIMPPRPQAGQSYLEEFSLGNAEDVSTVLSASYGWGAGGALDRFVPKELAQRLCNRDCVVTKNWSPLEPGAFALKYYARGIGFFLETKPDEGTAIQLVECNFDPRCVALPAPAR